ncbi:16S rRNA (guanine(527)-N(7))-methyltransferase RsmG [Candidatus Gracilibacteria bacterium GN02-872]|nr:16S rRNA (guanine(527)-N(7))-methyltransferase RsmG [Candidatus Gracilibacteria bacterium GN02-872]RKW21853.1 MAG: 16S rRNA (guanine(527)-N(7))-methyltransferase RsmG [Candidatus Gracilibacteria bacterium]
MQEIFKKYKIELEQSEIEKFQKFLEIFKEKNSQINLSAIRDDEGIIEKHFVDSVILNIFLDFFEFGENPKIADLGTGGGFPLIPLAIVNPSAQFVGIDSVGKKLKAIDEFVENLNLKNVKTLNGRAEEIGQNLDYRESFDFVVSRATAYLPTLLEYAIPLLKVGGIFCAYKLEDREELQTSKKALARLGAKIIKVKNYRLAEQDRVIIFIEKLEKTASKYPRKNGIPLQNPIK